MKLGDAYVVTDTNPWPERAGLTAREVIPEGDEANVYPFHGVSKAEMVVFIADDPLRQRALYEANENPFGRTVEELDRWTCVMYRTNLRPA